LTNNRFKLASFEGCLFNVYDDLGELPMSDCGKFKNLTGGYDHEIERKGKQGYPARLTNVQLYTCNNAPMVSENIKRDAAFWERWEFVEFETRFETDTQFFDREYTQEVKEGFLLKIIEAVMQVHQDNKLLVISDSGEVREKWFSNSDPIFQYLEACTFSTTESKLYLDRKALLDSFTLWCNDKQIPETKRLKTVESFTSGVSWYEINTKKWDGLACTKSGRYQGKVFVFPYAFKMDDESQKYKVDSIN
jgi:phage/plasmid-associated DNA primase